MASSTVQNQATAARARARRGAGGATAAATEPKVSDEDRRKGLSYGKASNGHVLNINKMTRDDPDLARYVSDDLTFGHALRRLKRLQDQVLKSGEKVRF